MVHFEKKNQIAIATLTRENALNALTLEMVEQLAGALPRWNADPDIAVIVLRGSGPKAFCAGGDVKTVCQRLKNGDHKYGEDFFRIEYEVDHLIHAGAKPVLAIGHGITMGGGIGLFAGATARIATNSSVFAMPEISIGLFPDVGGSYFLNRMPGRLGLFLALTGARFNATDAIDIGLADAFIPDDKIAMLLQRLLTAEWDEQPVLNIMRLRRLVAESSAAYLSAMPEAQLRPRFAVIDKALSSQEPLEAFRELGKLARSDDEYLAKAAQTFLKGSPTSAHLAFEQLKRGKSLALKECFEMELRMAAQCCRHHDFYEGVRSVLIDKDHAPKWKPAKLEDVSRALIERHFTWPATES